MAKITKKNVLSVQGIVNIENGKITFSVEDIEGEIALAELMSDSVSYTHLTLPTNSLV